MDFALSETASRLRDDLLAFMDEKVYAAEPMYRQQLEESGDQHFHPPVLIRVLPGRLIPSFPNRVHSQLVDLVFRDERVGRRLDRGEKIGGVGLVRHRSTSS